VLDARHVQARRGGDALAAVPRRLEAVGAEQRRDVGGRRRDVAVQPARDGVDRVAGQRWEPRMSEQDREREYARWKKAVSRSMDWVD